MYTKKTTHRHVGLILSTTANNTERTLQATKMIRNTFFSLVGSGLHPSNINPITIVKTFQSVCLPRGLYECELWSNITSREIHMLEVTLRFCAKYMQHFIKRSKTDIVLACLGITDTLSEIDKRKLLFLRRLCVSPHSARVKHLFIHRLLCYKRRETSSQSQYGYIHDIYRILVKYQLIDFFVTFINEGVFPQKCVWRNIVRRAVRLNYVNRYKERADNDICMLCYIDINPSCLKPLFIWQAALRYPHRLKEFTFLARLCVTNSMRENSCLLCGNISTDVTTHFFCSCPKLNSNREYFWNTVIPQFDVKLEAYLCDLSDEKLTAVILGAEIDFFKDSSDKSAHHYFMYLIATCWYFGLL